MQTYLSLFVVYLFIYLFIYLLLNVAQSKAWHPVAQKSPSLGDRFSWLGDIYGK